MARTFNPVSADRNQQSATEPQKAKGRRVPDGVNGVEHVEELQLFLGADDLAVLAAVAVLRAVAVQAPRLDSEVDAVAKPAPPEEQHRRENARNNTGAKMQKEES